MTSNQLLTQRLPTYTDLPAVKIQEKLKEANTLCSMLEATTIQDPEQADQYGGLLKAVHKEITELDNLRKEVGKPAREAQLDINDFFRPALKAYNRAKDLLKNRLRTYADSVQEANQAALEQASTGDGAALARVVPEAPAAGTSTRKELRIDIIDFDKIPRKHLSVDWSGLKILAQSGGEAPPGVQFRWVEKIVVGR
jgi:hypothetical protein